MSNEKGLRKKYIKRPVRMRKKIVGIFCTAKKEDLENVIHARHLKDNNI